MRTLVAIALIGATVVVGACRREVAVEPLKLGGPTAEAMQKAR
jgi:hypothetical protein